MNVVVGSYGGGTNSTAVYIGMVERGDPPPVAILMADTMGEKPHTYAFRDTFSAWLISHGYPPITMVQARGRRGERRSLEEACLKNGVMPSVAYGWKTCSQRFKLKPQENWMNASPVVQEALAQGETVTKLVGIDFGELHRMWFGEEPGFATRYPLIEWRWAREECVAAIERAGLPQPGKSACFFCPNSKIAEIFWLRDNHPDLLARALHIERMALESGKGRTNPDGTPKVKGLGRRFSWASVIARDPVALEAGEEDKEMPCNCYDGVFDPTAGLEGIL